MRGLVLAGAALALLASTPSPAPAQSGAGLEAYRQGEALYAAGRYAEAEPRWREALVRAERELGPEHPGTAGLLGNLAALYRQEGRTDEAGALQAGGLDHRASVPALTGGSPRPPCSVRYRDTPQFSGGIAESVIRRWGSPSANARPETPDQAVGRGARPGPINP